MIEGTKAKIVEDFKFIHDALLTVLKVGFRKNIVSRISFEITAGRIDGITSDNYIYLICNVIYNFDSKLNELETIEEHLSNTVFNSFTHRNLKFTWKTSEGKFLQASRTGVALYLPVYEVPKDFWDLIGTEANLIKQEFDVSRVYSKFNNNLYDAELSLEISDELKKFQLGAAPI